MPTIDALPAATAAADTDEVIVSQGGVTRKVTRVQLLASAQPAIALLAGQLVGRTGTTAGGPQPVTIGGNLRLAGGILSGTTSPFAIAGLAPAASPAIGDLVALSQSGTMNAASYAQFMAGIAAVPGVNASAMTATATSGTTARRLADLLAGSIAVEDFGAAGDGATDDTAAFAAALASGQPIRLGAKTYAVSGQFTIGGGNVAMLGTAGQTVLRRLRQSGGGAWISVQSAGFHATGITFDANTAITTDAWGVLVTPACLRADFHQCVFTNARGATMGAGLTFQAADPAVTGHAIRDCEALGNALHGIWVQALQNVQIDGCRAHDNGAYGICIDYTDPAFLQKLHVCQVVGNTAWNNQRGISVGNFNATNSNPPVWGNANPDAIGLLVANNICHDNSLYGIAAAGRSLLVSQNMVINNGVPGGAGILANVAYSRVAGNIVVGAAQYGIDAGGAINTDIVGNHVSAAVHGITPGGSTNVRVADNTIQDCTGWSILVNNVETDGAGLSFNLACNDLLIADNWIGFSIGGGGGGILLADNPQNVRVVRNCIVGSGPATIGQALWPHSNSVTIEGNTWNFSPRGTITGTGTASSAQLVFPDLLDRATVNSCPGPVQSLLSLRQQALAAQIGFVAVTAGGSGYSHASVTISGDGAGATAIAYVTSGTVIGIGLTNPGAGYSTATVSITGDGTGAAAAPQIALPVVEQRAITLRCNAATLFSRTATPAQQNWTNFDFTVPAAAEITFNGRNGIWRAANVALSDYIAPDGLGGVVVASVANGDVVLQPNGTGHLRLTTTAEPTGITFGIGRGAPNGVVAAPPGSDYRNLNGGAGATCWIKQTGTGNTGWIAIA